MKKVVAAIAVFVGVALLASSMAFAADIKIGYVDYLRIRKECKAGKSVDESIATMFKDKQTQLDKRQKEIEDELADLQNRSSMLSESARKQTEDKLQKKYRDMQRFKDDSEEELNKKRAEMEQSVMDDLKAIINKYGNEEGYTLILESTVVLYAPDAVDITDKIIAAYDKSKGGA